MHLAIVGSTTFTGWWELAAAEGIIDYTLATWKPKTVISGGAVGIDSLAAQVAARHGITVTVHAPANQRWEPHGFKDRNLLIAEGCDALLAIRSRNATTYGSGWTADRAEEMGKKVRRILL